MESRLSESSFFIVRALGRTYPIKDELSSWAFYWNFIERVWINDYVDAAELQHFMHKCVRGNWPGVILACEKRQDDF